MEKLTVYDIHCVDERLSNIYNLSSPMHPAVNLALQSSPQVYAYST